MKASPTQRSLKLLRDEGYTAQVVEKWNQFAHIRQDLFGFIDIVAIKSGEPVLGVQTTSAKNINAREIKARKSINLALWLNTGSNFELHGWSKKGKLGKRKLWQVNRKMIKRVEL